MIGDLGEVALRRHRVVAQLGQGTQRDLSDCTGPQVVDDQGCDVGVALVGTARAQRDVRAHHDKPVAVSDVIQVQLDQAAPVGGDARGIELD
ncbi:hypothetical protein GCM10023321_50430 [Pseudonocardia eucalypti]|uniref:Uncharacterized protein n=1 Tax=Pseudonocardia eucalypti TaxID=648755 RepID=A0ABP9QKE5_9PSEU